MWGRPVSLLMLSSLMGNTPKHVGMRTAKSFNKLILEEHPHACGDDRSS